MTATALDLDLATLVGEMEDVPCEHSQHGDIRFSNRHNEAAASHYVRPHCPGCGRTGRMIAVCPAYMVSIARGDLTRCRECEDVRPASSVYVVLGPVNGRSS